MNDRDATLINAAERALLRATRAQELLGGTLHEDAVWELTLSLSCLPCDLTEAASGGQPEVVAQAEGLLAPALRRLVQDGHAELAEPAAFLLRFFEVLARALASRKQQQSRNLLLMYVAGRVAVRSVVDRP